MLISNAVHDRSKYIIRSHLKKKKKGKDGSDEKKAVLCVEPMSHFSTGTVRKEIKTQRKEMGIVRKETKIVRTENTR